MVIRLKMLIEKQVKMILGINAEIVIVVYFLP